MRRVKLDGPAGGSAGSPRLGRLTRHLKARLLDFGPGGPEVLEADEARGLVTVRFPGQKAAGVLEILERDFGVHAVLDGENAQFRLKEDTRFEDLDYVWGSLFEVLG